MQIGHQRLHHSRHLVSHISRPERSLPGFFGDGARACPVKAEVPRRVARFPGYRFVLAVTAQMFWQFALSASWVLSGITGNPFPGVAVSGWLTFVQLQTSCCQKRPQILDNRFLLLRIEEEVCREREPHAGRELRQLLLQVNQRCIRVLCDSPGVMNGGRITATASPDAHPVVIVSGRESDGQRLGPSLNPPLDALTAFGGDTKAVSS
jgi:hypothetical protein